jgi:hypothetical protein
MENRPGQGGSRGSTAAPRPSAVQPNESTDKNRWHRLVDAIQASNLPPSDRSVFRFLLDKSNYGTGELPKQFTPSQSKIAKGTGLSPRMVRYALQHLRRHGWVASTGSTNKVQYTLAAGSLCDCAGRVHQQPSTTATERTRPVLVLRQPEPPTKATVAAVLRQPTTATPQVKPLVALRGNEREESEENPANGERDQRVSMTVDTSRSKTTNGEPPEEVWSADVSRVADDEGHRWPITGYTCTVCGWPLDPVHADIGTHPTCDPNPVDWSRWPDDTIGAELYRIGT